MGAGVEVGELRRRLVGRLPEQLVPAVLVELERLPVSANGKLDRGALPEPERGRREGYEAPEGREEEVLAGIWERVLGVERVGRRDNFFELGGDSILSLRVASQAVQAGLGLTPRQVFERPTVGELAAVAVNRTEY